MPRHPPCALKQQTHTNNPTHKQNTHKQKTRCSRPLYSSHTPHPPPPTSPHDQPANDEPHREQPPTHKHARRHHVLPQTPNSAPMTNHNKGWKKFSSYRFMHPVPTPPSILKPGWYVSTWNFTNKRRQHHLRALNQQTPTTVGHKKAP